jgi:hypothetical protein
VADAAELGRLYFEPNHVLRAVACMRPCVAPYIVPLSSSVPTGKYAGLDPSDRRIGEFPGPSAKLWVESYMPSNSTNP